MRKCRKCNIEYNGNLELCPLCQTEMVGKKTESVFPKLKQPKETTLYKILSFVSFSIGILFAFIEYTIFKTFTISKYIIVGLLTNYILVKFILKNYKDVLKMMNKYFWVILFLCFIWYFTTKSLIITTYLIPILCLVIFAFNSIIMLVLKDNYIIKFARTILFDCMIGLIPLLLVALNLSTFELLSYICAVLDLLIFTGLIIFCKDNILDELKKIFNY